MVTTRSVEGAAVNWLKTATISSRAERFAPALDGDDLVGNLDPLRLTKFLPAAELASFGEEVIRIPALPWQSGDSKPSSRDTHDVK